MEHYGFELSPEVIRQITLARAGEISDEELYPEASVGSKQLIAECDGSMVPIVETGSREGSRDGRSARTLSWKEARICFARDKNEVMGYFRATMGSTELVGNMWRECAIAAGLKEDTFVHCVGDGARWIREQAEVAFGADAEYLTDFYHVSEYLGEAAPLFDKDTDRWRRQQ